MKNKRKGLIALVLFLVLAIGIGYAAASTDSVAINGSASAVAGSFDIQFVTTGQVTTATHGTATITAAGAYTSVDVATMTVSGLKAVGDYATATYTIKNASTDVNADITAAVSTDVADTTHYKVTVTGGATAVAPNATTTVTVKVELLKAFSDETTANAVKTFTVTATGTAAE